MLPQNPLRHQAGELTNSYPSKVYLTPCNKIHIKTICDSRLISDKSNYTQ